MGEGSGRGGIGEVVGGNIHRLHRGNGPALGGGDALLEGSHLVGQGGLVAHGGGHAAHEGRHLAARLDIAEDVVNEQQHVLVLLVPEVLRHGQTGKGHPHAGPGGLVHLSEYQGRFRDDAGLRHLPPQVAALRVRSPTPVKME